MSWKKVKIGELFKVEKGTLQSSKCTEGKYNFITASSEWKTHNAYSYDCEALVFAAAASGSLGRTHYVNGKFIASDLCFILQPKNYNEYPLNLRFYKILFDVYKVDIVKNTKSGTSKEAIGLKVFGNYLLPYIDKELQDKIIEKYAQLAEITNTFNQQTQIQLDKVAKLRQAFLQEAISGQLVDESNIKITKTGSELLAEIQAEKDQLIKDKKIKKSKPLPPIKDEEIPFSIPQNWTWCRLGEICKNITDGFHHTPNKTEKGIPYISATHIRYDYINWNECLYTDEKDFEELYKKTNHKKGDLLITNRGAGCGTPAIIDTENKFSFQNMGLLSFNNTLVNSRFFLYYIISIQTSIVDKFVNGGLQPMLSNIMLSKVIIPLPPLENQKAIVEKLDKLMTYCDQLEAQIKQQQQTTQELEKTLLSELLNN